MKRLLLAVSMLWCSAAVLATGCTKSQPPRSFVQPNALKKADFTGTWYYNATVVDAPATNGAVYEGQYGSLEKIKWVITEDTLFAVRSYPFITNQENRTGDHANVDGSDTYEGEPLAAWKIQSHFDIIRDYNPSTGEETNRIIESTERPWQDREYFRVDWSKNLAPDYSGIGLDWTFSDVNATELSYYVSDPNSPDALHVERADDKDADLGFSSGEMNYFDITAQMILDPVEESFVIDEAGNTMKLPACFAYYGTEDCAAQKVKLRHSFSKVPTATTYEKREWDGIDQQTFGFFTTELRHNWDPLYGDQYTGDKRFIERFNFFTGSCKTPGTSCEAPHRVRSSLDGTWLTKYTDADLATGDVGGDVRGVHLSESQAICKNLMSGTCKNIGGVDVGMPDTKHGDDEYYWEGTDRVPLTASVSNGSTSFSGDDNFVPASARTVQTIPYFPNEEMPDDIWQDSKEVIRQWNLIFQAAASDQMGRQVTENIFTWCHNPVQAGDDAACTRHLKADVDADGNVKKDGSGNPIYRVRWGDPRYSSILWLGEYQAGGPLGLGPAMSDPETGETISAKANIYGGDLLTYAAYARDLLALENGTISADNYVNGVNLDAWTDQQKTGVGFAAMPHGFTDDEKMAAVTKMNFKWARGLSVKPIDSSSPKALLTSIRARESDMLKNSGRFGNGNDLMQAQLTKLNNTPLEAAMETPELLAAAGMDPSTDFASLKPDTKAQFTALNLPKLSLAREQKLARFEAFGYDFEPFNYNVIEGESQRYKNMKPADIYEDLKNRIFIAVTLHEVGHNMGLRHNFRATFDAMNYFPDYWNTREAAAKLDHPGEVVDGTNGHVKLYARSNVKGAWSDQAELSSKAVTPAKWQTAADGTTFDPGPTSQLGLQYSSIMDYGAAFNTDLAGLGRYDAAAIKFGYANYVEVFTDTKADPTAQWALGSLQQFNNAYGFPSAMLVWDAAHFQAVNYYSFPEYMNHGVDSIQQRKDVPAYDVVNHYFSVPLAFGRSWDASINAAVDGSGNLSPQVPYYFCSDEFVGNLTCQRFDFGADAYEQAFDIIHRYENYYVLRNFKRNNFSFHTGPGYVNYTLDRYFEILREQMTWYTLLRADYEDFNNLIGEPQTNLLNFLANDDTGWGSFSVAIDQAMAMFGRVLTAPNAGTFLESDDGNGNSLWKQFRDDNTQKDPTLLNIGITDGRYEDTSWNFDACAYYAFDECQQRIGYFLDKYVALYALSESQAYFTGRDTSVDVRKYAIGYYIPYKSQLTSTFGNMISGNITNLAPVYHGENEPIEHVDITTGRVPTLGANDKRVDPTIGFSLQMWSSVFGITGFSSTFDHDFIENTRVFVVGNGEAPVPDSQLLDSSGNVGPLATFNASDLVANGGSKSWLLYTEPNTGLTYAAHSVAQQGVVDQSGTNMIRQDIAVQMLEHAKQLHDRIALPTVDQLIATKNYNDYVQNLDMMRSLHSTFGYGPFEADQ